MRTDSVNVTRLPLSATPARASAIALEGTPSEKKAPHPTIICTSTDCTECQEERGSNNEADDQEKSQPRPLIRHGQLKSPLVHDRHSPDDGATMDQSARVASRTCS